MTEYTLSETYLQELRERLRQLEIIFQERDNLGAGRLLLLKYLAKVSGTISARSDGPPVTFGSGTVTLYKRNTDNEAEAITDGNGVDITQTVYSFAGTASGTDAWMWVGQDSLGTWWYLNEACS